MKRRVFVTLVTSESYLPGAYTLLKSIRRYSQLPCYIVTTFEGDILNREFDKVIFIDKVVFESNEENLTLLNRRDLRDTLTKLHVFNIDADEAVYLDADALLLSNIDDLFDYLTDKVVFAAAPDVGWPDCFNSGVFAFRPSKSLFESLMLFASNNTSFDGIIVVNDRRRPGAS